MPGPREQKRLPTTPLVYPDIVQGLDLRLHFLADGSFRRERAATLSVYACSVQTQEATTGERLVSVAGRKGTHTFLFERLVEMLGSGGLALPHKDHGGFDRSDPRALTAARRIAEDNNQALTYGWRFERLAGDLPGLTVPKGKPGIHDLPWDPDPVFQHVLDQTQRNNLDGAWAAVKSIDPARREGLFDEVLYLKFCINEAIRAQDLRYVARKYVRRSILRQRLEDEFDDFLDLVDPLLPSWQQLTKSGWPWSTLRPWGRFKHEAYRRLVSFGHPGAPRGRIFIWHPDLYAQNATVIDEAFRPCLVRAENLFRRARAIPEIGRKWRSQSALFDLVQARFPDAVFQWSPPWLGRQRVDIYVPSLELALEYQGEQHYRPISFFGGEAGLAATQIRDAQKRQSLERRGIRLAEWSFDRPITEQALTQLLGALEQPQSRASRRNSATRKRCGVSLVR